jgi:hypothetical protein
MDEAYPVINIEKIAGGDEKPERDKERAANKDE